MHFVPCAQAPPTQETPHDDTAAARPDDQSSGLMDRLFGLHFSNAYWVLFALGFFCPFCWLCGSVGLTSTKPNEWIAGLLNLMALVFSLFVTIALVALWI